MSARWNDGQLMCDICWKQGKITIRDTFDVFALENVSMVKPVIGADELHLIIDENHNSFGQHIHEDCEAIRKFEESLP